MCKKGNTLQVIKFWWNLTLIFDLKSYSRVLDKKTENYWSDFKEF